jgi:hypothetical protein
MIEIIFCISATITLLILIFMKFTDPNDFTKMVSDSIIVTFLLSLLTAAITGVSYLVLL